MTKPVSRHVRLRVSSAGRPPLFAVAAIGAMVLSAVSANAQTIVLPGGPPFPGGPFIVDGTQSPDQSYTFLSVPFDPVPPSTLVITSDGLIAPVFPFGGKAISIGPNVLATITGSSGAQPGGWDIDLDFSPLNAGMISSAIWIENGSFGNYIDDGSVAPPDTTINDVNIRIVDSAPFFAGRELSGISTRAANATTTIDNVVIDIQEIGNADLVAAGIYTMGGQNFDVANPLAATAAPAVTTVTASSLGVSAWNASGVRSTSGGQTDISNSVISVTNIFDGTSPGTSRGYGIHVGGSTAFYPQDTNVVSQDNTITVTGAGSDSVSYGIYTVAPLPSSGFISASVQAHSTNDVIAVTGTEVHGLYADTGLSGPGAFGVITPFTNEIFSTDTTVTVTGTDGGSGATAHFGGQITLERNTIDVNGPGVHGLVVDTGSVTPPGLNQFYHPTFIHDTDSVVTVADGDGGQVYDGGELILTGTDLTAGGNGVFVSNPTVDNAAEINTVILDGATMDSGTDSFHVDAAVANVTVEGGSTVTSDTDIGLNAINNSTVDFTVDASDLIGDLISDATSTVDAVLQNGGSVTGMISDINTVLVGAGSEWTVTDVSTVRDTLTNAGTIAFESPVAGAYKTVTTDLYVSEGGSIHFNTFVGDDASPTDRLVTTGIQVGAGGATQVFVNNMDPTQTGAQTRGDGIELVEVTDAANSAAGAFVLGARVAAGAYEYTLFHNGVADPADGDWYLRSNAVVPAVPADPVGPLAPMDPVDPVDPAAPAPNYRAEVPLYMAAPGLAHRFGLVTLGTLHDRRGYMPFPAPATGAPVPTQTIWCKDAARDFRCALTPEQEKVYADAATGADNPGSRALWGRIFGGTGEHQPTDSSYFDITAAGASSFVENGPSYDYDFAGFQAGRDLFGREGADGSIDVAGLYLGFGRINADVNGVYAGNAGSTALDGYSVGAYWTRFGASGWYLDAVAQGTWFADIDARSVPGERLETEGWSAIASLEAGYPFRLGNGWTLEPQAQLVYQHIALDGGADSFGFVDYEDSDTAQGRIGARVARTFDLSEDNGARSVTLWGRASLWHDFDGTARTRFSSLQNLNAEAFEASLGGTWAEVGLGLSSQVSENVSIFLAGDYSFSVDSASNDEVGGRAGIKVAW